MVHFHDITPSEKLHKSLSVNRRIESEASL